jgi:Cys-Gly metallodipeptidase DUG1
MFVYKDLIFTGYSWRYPTLSLHGIEGAFHSAGAKTVIPAKVIGKFSIRTVPNQDPKKITELVSAHVSAEFKKLKSKNQMKFECMHAGKWWISDPVHWNYVAAAQAIEKVYGVKPDLTREGGSIPVTLTFQDELKRNVLLLPIGACDDGAHSINEKIDRRNYIQGIKLLGSYLHELAKASS